MSTQGLNGRARWRGDYVRYVEFQALHNLGANTNAGWMLIVGHTRILLVEDVFVRIAAVMRDTELEQGSRHALPHFDVVADEAHWSMTNLGVESSEHWELYHEPTRMKERLSITTARAIDRFLAQECAIAETHRSKKRSTGKRYRAVLSALTS